MQRIFFFHVIVLTLFIAPHAVAQGVTTAAFHGQVFDTDREPLPGAHVVAVHQPTGTQYGTATRADGRYNLPQVQVGGPYTVTVSFIGFHTAEETSITLALGDNRTVNFVLTEDVAQLGDIVVTATSDSIFDSSRSGASTNVSTEQIEGMPTISRSIQDFTRLSPQVAGYNIGGRNNRLNNIQLDGAIMKDAFGLPDSGTPGGQINAEPISLDAVAEFQVQAAPYDVRQSGFTGGLVNAVTRQGTNTYEGSAYFYGRNQSFVGLSPDDNRLSLDEFGEFQTGFRVGGPILRNEVFFFLSGEIRQLDQPLGGGLLGSGAANEFVGDEQTLQQIINIAEAYGLNPGGYDSFTNNTSDTKLFGRIDWNISPQHRLTLRHNFVDGGADRGMLRGRNVWSFADHNYIFRSVQNSTVLQLNSTLSPSLFTEARIGYTRVRDKRDYGNAPAAPSILVRIPNGGSVSFGQERSSQQNQLDQDIFEVTASGTYYTGDLIFTFGTDNQYSSFMNLFLQDYFGHYEFDSVEDFEAGAPARYRHTYANPDMSGLPDAPVAEWSYLRAGLFGQAEWRAMSNLNVTAGVRLDVPFFLTDPLYNEAFEQAFGLRTDETPSGKLQFSPRLAFNWDVNSDRSTQLRGGIGLFSGPPLGVWMSNQYGNTGVDLVRLDARNLPAGFFSPDPHNQPLPNPNDPDNPLAPEATTGIALTDPDFKFPQVLRMSLGVDQRLPVWGLVASAEAQYSPAINDVFFENINLGDQVGSNAVDGRPVFTPRREAAFTNAILMRNTNKGYTTNLSLQLELPQQDGFFGRIAYNFQQSRDMNSGGSSVAQSNWNGNATAGNPNAEVLASSLWEVPHRALLAVSYRGDLLGGVVGVPGFNTTFSLIYEGMSGRPFSYVFNRDVNGDGEAFNDLMYVPESRAELVISDEDWAVLNAFIEGDSYLSSRRGQIAERNGARAPWNNRIDLRIAQEIPTFRSQRVELTMDILNVLNLFNGDWGHYRVMPRTFSPIQLAAAPIDDGRYVVSSVNIPDEIGNPDNLLSRWQMQLGIRYTF